MSLHLSRLSVSQFFFCCKSIAVLSFQVWRAGESTLHNSVILSSSLTSLVKLVQRFKGGGNLVRIFEVLFLQRNGCSIFQDHAKTLAVLISLKYSLASCLNLAPSPSHQASPKILSVFLHPKMQISALGLVLIVLFQ